MTEVKILEQQHHFVIYKGEFDQEILLSHTADQPSLRILVIKRCIIKENSYGNGAPQLISQTRRSGVKM